jgi:hypothetical protein
MRSGFRPGPRPLSTAERIDRATDIDGRPVDPIAGDPAIRV